MGKNTPLRNIIGNISVIMSICAVSWSFVKEVITMPNPTKEYAQQEQPEHEQDVAVNGDAE